MTGKALLEWLQAIPPDELEKAEVYLEIRAAGPGDTLPLITAKYYKYNTDKQATPTIYLIYK